VFASALLFVAGSLALASCSSSAPAEAQHPGVGPGGPIDAGSEAANTKPDGAPADDDDGSEPAVCTADASPGTQSVTCEGFDVKVTIPSSCPSAGCGLILDLHGALMNADTEDSHTELRARAGAKGFVVVQPTGHTRTYGGLTGPQWFNDDDAALHRLVVALVRDLGIDRARVHATGFSQGGFAVLRLMCKYADLFASVAPGAAGTNGCPLDESIIASCSMQGSDKPSRAIDVLFLYGRKDAIVPESCAEGVAAAIATGFALGAPQTIASDATYTRLRYEGGGVVLETLAHDYTTDPGSSLAINKGHCVPGSKANTGSIWDALACEGTSAFVWGTEVTSLFVAHPRP
jgi:pimeloyl-ACP methyl ester carboxylesterase